MADEQQASQEPEMDFTLTAMQFAAIMSALNTQTITSIQAMQALKGRAEATGFNAIVKASIEAINALKDQAEAKAAEEQAAAAKAAEEQTAI